MDLFDFSRSRAARRLPQTRGARTTGPVPALAGLAAAGALTFMFIQIERGIGNVMLSLLYVAHNLMLCAVLAIGGLLLTRRFWTSVLAGVSAVLLLWFASKLKVDAVTVPLLAGNLRGGLSAWPVIVDFGWPVMVAATTCAVLVVLCFLSERPVSLGASRRLVCFGSAVGLLGASGAIHARIPAEDAGVVTVKGPLIALFTRSLYAKPDFGDARFPELGPYCCFRNASQPTVQMGGDAGMPHIVVVLQESTFQPGNLAGVEPVDNRLFSGSAPLAVDVVGGGTWVEEYALLHGVPPSVYGRDFMQILWLGRARGLEPRLAPMLARAGYQTLSILPFFSHILNDAEGMQYALGFERVVDCSKINGCEEVALAEGWNAVPDAVIYDHALEELRAADQPLLVYLATMRQHSPHVRSYPLHAHRDGILTEYLRRLDLSAQEGDAFLRSLQTLERPTVVLMFGDHVPTDVHRAFEAGAHQHGPRQTFFNLYDRNGEGVAASFMAQFPTVNAPSTAFLDAILLRHAGFEGEYIDLKLAMMRNCSGAFCRSAAVQE